MFISYGCFYQSVSLKCFKYVIIDSKFTCTEGDQEVNEQIVVIDHVPYKFIFIVVKSVNINRSHNNERINHSSLMLLGDILSTYATQLLYKFNDTVTLEFVEYTVGLSIDKK